MAKSTFDLMEDGKDHFSMGRCSGCGDLIKLGQSISKARGNNKAFGR
jgi:hypothetical protein